MKDGASFFSEILNFPHFTVRLSRDIGLFRILALSFSLRRSSPFFDMLSRHLRRLVAASALSAAESSSLLAQQLLSSPSSSPFFVAAAVRSISSVSASSPSRAARLASASASSARSASGHAASCSYTSKVAQSELLGASQRGFAADAAVAAIDESDVEEEEDKNSSSVAVKTLPDVPPGSR